MSDNSLKQAEAQLSGVRELVSNLNDAHDSGDPEALDEARQRIHEDPLSVQARTEWIDPNQFHHPEINVEPMEYRILLCTGGPAVQIVGSLNQYGEPVSAVIEHNDWFGGWESYLLNDEEEEDVLEYARSFYYGA